MDDLETARRLVLESGPVIALTGAGISAESGIPTFRGPAGLWRNFRPEALATPEAFNRDPKFVWEWYDWRRGLIAAAQPNAGHLTLAEHQVAIVTQNVDGLHERAGSKLIARLHGDIWTLRCTNCAFEWRDLSPHLDPLPPHCDRCSALARPGVVWFGEQLPDGPWRQAQRLIDTAGLVLVIGTSAVVFPAAELIFRARRVIEINPDETPVSSRVDLSLRGPAAEILPILFRPPMIASKSSKGSPTNE